MDYIVGVFCFIFGAIIASFNGVVIHRVPLHLSIVSPGSMCAECKEKIKWYDNIPILSYIILRGKCRHCHTRIGISSLILEIVGGLVFLLAFIQFRYSFDTVFCMLISWILIIIAGIDYKHHVIYDWSSIIFLALSIAYFIYNITFHQLPYWDFIIGGAIGFLVFFLIRVVGKWIKKVECLGMGDVILMGIAGLLLGYKSLLLAVLFGTFIGSIIELTLIALKKKDRNAEIAFGPYLILGILIALFYGQAIIEWYLRLVI